MRHVFRGYAAVRDEAGEVTWQSGLLENALMNQGEMDVLNVYLLEQAHKTKYLALLDMSGLVDPTESDTIATLYASESKSPGSGGYSRQQVLSTDWGAPFLSGDDYRVESTAGKVFGPFTATAALITHVLIVTSATGTASPATLALAHIPLGIEITVPVGQTFTFTPSISAF